MSSSQSSKPQINFNGEFRKANYVPMDNSIQPLPLNTHKSLTKMPLLSRIMSFSIRNSKDLQTNLLVSPEFNEAINHYSESTIDRLMTTKEVVWASKRGDAEFVKRALLTERTDIDYSQAIPCLIEKSKYNEVLEMFGLGLDINGVYDLYPQMNGMLSVNGSFFGSLLSYSAYTASVSFIKGLLDRGIKTGNAGEMHYAARRVKPNALELLIQYGGNINSRNNGEYKDVFVSGGLPFTPLLVALHYKRYDNIKFLLERGAVVIDDTRSYIGIRSPRTSITHVGFLYDYRYSNPGSKLSVMQRLEIAELLIRNGGLSFEMEEEMIHPDETTGLRLIDELFLEGLDKWREIIKHHLQKGTELNSYHPLLQKAIEDRPQDLEFINKWWKRS